MKLERPVGHLEDGAETVGRGLVRPEDPEVVRVEPDDLGQPLAEHPGRLADRAGRPRHVHGEVELHDAQIVERGNDSAGIDQPAQTHIAQTDATGERRRGSCLFHVKHRCSTRLFL